MLFEFWNKSVNSDYCCLVLVIGFDVCGYVMEVCVVNFLCGLFDVLVGVVLVVYCVYWWFFVLVCELCFCV